MTEKRQVYIVKFKNWSDYHATPVLLVDDVRSIELIKEMVDYLEDENGLGRTHTDIKPFKYYDQYQKANPEYQEYLEDFVNTCIFERWNILSYDDITKIYDKYKLTKDQEVKHDWW